MEIEREVLNEIGEKLEKRFVCVRCNNQEGYYRRIATTGDGLSRLIELQHNRFFTVSCKRCGYTDFFDLDLLRERNFNWEIFDEVYGVK